MNTAATPASDELELMRKFRDSYDRLRSEMAKVVVGQEEVIEQLLTAVFSRGHCLLVGVPGLAKTLMVSTLAKTMDLSFNRIQFTPDLMPSDITGTEVIQEDRATGNRIQKFMRGPIFANFILADEINRTPPKTQAALLEAMQEHSVTSAGTRHALDEPFFVLATQNPIEQEGTYPLPEAQLDRFMFMVMVRYPTRDEEFSVMKLTTGEHSGVVEPVITRAEVLKLQEIVRKVPVADSVINYVLDLVRKTRLGEPEAPDYIRKWLSWGAGPRAAQYMILGSKARALLHGRYHVAIEDVKAVAKPVLRHRIITNFNAEAEGVKPDDIVEKLIADTKPLEDALSGDERVTKLLKS
ncbi:MAG: MoxR family ATPase [Planctomycetota bacterium]